MAVSLIGDEMDGNDVAQATGAELIRMLREQPEFAVGVLGLGTDVTGSVPTFATSMITTDAFGEPKHAADAGFRPSGTDLAVEGVTFESDGTRFNSIFQIEKGTSLTSLEVVGSVENGLPVFDRLLSETKDRALSLLDRNVRMVVYAADVDAGRASPTPRNYRHEVGDGSLNLRSDPQKIPMPHVTTQDGIEKRMSFMDEMAQEPVAMALGAHVVHMLRTQPDLAAGVIGHRDPSTPVPLPVQTGLHVGHWNEDLPKDRPPLLEGLSYEQTGKDFVAQFMMANDGYSTLLETSGYVAGGVAVLERMKASMDDRRNQVKGELPDRRVYDAEVKDGLAIVVGISMTRSASLGGILAQARALDGDAAATAKGPQGLGSADLHVALASSLRSGVVGR